LKIQIDALQFSPCACCVPVSSTDSESVTPPLRSLSLVLVLVLFFSAVEWLTSHYSHSLALLADSGHMMADGGALGLALWATWSVRRQTVANRKRESWAALANGIGLLAMAGLVAWEAVRHLQGSPTEILSLPMLGVALLGLVVNGISAALLHRDSRRNLNLRGAFLHVVADLLGSIGSIVAAISIYLFDWQWVDTAIGFGIAGIVAMSAVPVVWQSWQVLQRSETEIDRSRLETVGWMELGQANLATQIQRKSSKRSAF